MAQTSSIHIDIPTKKQFIDKYEKGFCTVNLR